MNRLRNFFVVGLSGSLALILGGIGWIQYSLQESYRDYDQLAACLTRHGFAVEDGWQRSDVGLEAYGLIFQLSDGQKAEIQVLDGAVVRDCGDRPSGLFISGEGNNYLPFDQPELVAALGGEPIRTAQEAIAQLETLLAWAAAHPDALLSHAEMTDADGDINSDGYINLMIPPL